MGIICKHKTTNKRFVVWHPNLAVNETFYIVLNAVDWYHSCTNLD